MQLRLTSDALADGYVGEGFRLSRIESFTIASKVQRKALWHGKAGIV